VIDVQCLLHTGFSSSDDDREERKCQLENKLIKGGKVVRLIRLQHLLKDEEQLKRWTELSPKLASTFHGTDYSHRTRKRTFAHFKIFQKFSYTLSSFFITP